MSDNESEFRKIVNKLKIDTEPDPAHRDKLRWQMLSVFNQTTKQPKPRNIVFNTLRRTIMQSHIRKLAAAAVIIIGVLLGLNIIGVSPDGSSVVWAEVLETVEQAKTVIYKMKLKMTGMSNMPEGKIVEMQINAQVSSQYGMRMDTYMEGKKAAETYIVLADEVIVSVIPEVKKYMRMTLTEELFDEMRKENGDPKDMVEQFTKYEYTELGRDTINGIEVEGIEARDPRIWGGAFGNPGDVFDNIVGSLWVDVETNLPVFMELDCSAEYGENGTPMQITMSISDFEWGAPVDPSVFEPHIPEDYELMAEVQMPKMDGEGVVKGLQAFADLTGGRYPTSLAIMAAMQEASDALRKKLLSDPNFSGTQPPQEDLQAIMDLQATCMFHMELIRQEKEPAYYGDTVTAEFPHAVLLRWKIDDDLYRVIFADLSTQDVTAEKLAELESIPLNINSYAIKPQPFDQAMVSSIHEAQLSWMPGINAAVHQVYFGTEPDQLPLLGETTEPSLTAPSALEMETTYYWRVDEVQPDGSIVPGDIWSFNTARLIAWWQFDDASGSTATDASGNGYNGTLAGEPLWTTGIVDGALQFNGDGDYVDACCGPDFDITDQITIAAWIKVNAFDKPYQAIITKGDNAWRLQRNAETNTIEFACMGVSGPDIWGSLFGSADVNDGQWHHLAGVYDGSKLYLYVDGGLDASRDAAGTINVNHHPVYIGENAQEKGRLWNGLIDDVRIYSYALSEDEIVEIYQAALPASAE